MAWWQKKLLRYALSRTGLLDDSALDPEKLDIALGRQNVIELKDVGLNIKRITKLAQLPPGLRVETARVLSLRLTVPADIYQSSIVAEVDGVELSLRLEEDQSTSPVKERRDRARSSVTARSPQHRKVHRRIPSPPPFDPGGLSDSEEGYLPTAEDLAKSFLQEEPLQERRQLEASLAADSKGLEESVASETSDELGTGAGIGLPGFLAGFLQGIVDRLQVSIKNVEANVTTEIPGDGSRPIPVTLRWHVGHAELQEAGSDDNATAGNDQLSSNRRKVNLLDISLNLLSDADIFSELSELPSHDSPSHSRQQDVTSSVLASPIAQPSSPRTERSHGSAATSGNQQAPLGSPDAMRASIATADSDRFADAGEDDRAHALEQSHSELDIQLGDDNISWGSRRSKSDAPSEDLWKSMVSEDDLPESLLLERAATPRARSSRGDSPTERRSHRDESPFAKALQSPGSWPRLEESPHRHSYPQSPGSWPVEQSRQSMFQSMTADLPSQSEDATDNKRAAIEASSTDVAELEVPPEPTTPEVEDLTVSKVFSHEEAESMYMSAMAPHSPEVRIPGGWSEESPEERSPSPQEVRRPLPQPIHHPTNDKDDEDEDLAYGEKPYSTPNAPRSETNTPRAQSPQPAADSSPVHEDKRALKQLLHIDSVVLLLPTSDPATTEAEPHGPRATMTSSSFHPQGMPGTFSAYSEMAKSRHQGVSFSKPSESVAWTASDNNESYGAAQSIAVKVGTIKCQVDISSGRLLYLLGAKALPVVTGTNDHEVKNAPKSSQQSVGGRTTKVTVDQVTLALCDALDEDSLLTSGSNEALDAKVTLHCQAIDVSSSPEQTVLRIGSIKMYLGTSCFLSFDRSRTMQTSTIITEQTPDIAVVITNKQSINRRPITEIVVETLPIALLVDLPMIDETFGSFGRLSGVLEIGNSILSESGLASPASSPVKRSKGVRFEGDPQYITARPELKLNARLSGVVGVLQGTTCSVQLQTSTVKAVYREAGVVATIEHIRLSGPQLSDVQHEAAAIDLTTVRLEYLLSPQDKDLERLLSLLTPSKDKYDNDDDILIDTLLRQRRKGAVARISTASARLVCHELENLSVLSTLAEELGKLSAVAKYLPDDERPGLLTLLRVKDFEARMPVNGRFGQLHVNVWEFHCAHVGLPALLALSIGNVNASQSGKQELLHPLVQHQGADNLPVIMARMLGDEVEPTIKVKLFNICLEYSVPIILALAGMDEEASREEVVMELAKSVADVALLRRSSDGKVSSNRSDSSASTSKKMNVELLIHDSAIGLKPQHSSSKALFVLTDAYLSSKLPAKSHAQASLDIRKAGLFVADQVYSDEGEGATTSRSAPSNSTTKPKLTAALSTQGFVSVGSIMKAKIVAKIDEAPASGTKSVDVDVRNELLLLETCADSTQTLIAILNGLAPPTPPSKQPQYLTEPMTIEDMVASFSGDAFPKPERPPETLFDVEEEPEDDPDLTLDAADLDRDDDGLLAESTMTSSLYGPIGSLMDDGDEGDDDEPGEYATETAESFLEEEDPFEMTVTPSDAPMSDSALVRELNKQCRPAVSDAPVDLGNYEIEDLGFDALGCNTNVLGTRHRFNTPAAKRMGAPTQSYGVELPFKLKLRDIHIIWNIYDGNNISHARTNIDQTPHRCKTSKHGGKLVALDIGHPYIIQCLMQWFEALQSIDDGMFEADVGCVENDEVLELIEMTRSQACVVYSLRLVVETHVHGVDFDSL